MAGRIPMCQNHGAVFIVTIISTSNSGTKQLNTCVLTKSLIRLLHVYSITDIDEYDTKMKFLELYINLAPKWQLHTEQRFLMITNSVHNYKTNV